MELDYCCQPALCGALLPDLDCGSQGWPSSSSFCDLEMTSGTASWVGCDVLLEEEADEEFSSKLLCQEFVLSQPVASVDPRPAMHIADSPTASLLQQQHSSASQCCSPCVSLSSLGSPAGHSHDHALFTTAIASASAVVHNSHLLHSAASAMLDSRGAGSRAGTPEPAHDLASQAASPQADLADADAVCTAALALRLCQGDVDAAMARLMSWAAAC